MSLPYNDFKSFCASSREAIDGRLRKGWGSIEHELRATEGHWHPNGFVVFRIQEDHALGAMRLHIWPDSDRATRADSPPLHSHAWHLCSRILVGTYRETVYEIENVPTAGSTPRYSAKIKYIDDPNTFLPNSQLHTRPVTEVSCEAGAFHEVPAGVAHETHINNGQFVATLLVTSPPQIDDVIVLGDQPFSSSSYVRPAISPDEAGALISRLARHWRALE